MTTEPTHDKIFWGLTADELAAQAKQAGEEAIDWMHAGGVPTVFLKDGVIYKHYPDGRIEPVKVIETAATQRHTASD